VSELGVRMPHTPEWQRELVAALFTLPRGHPLAQEAANTPPDANWCELEAAVSQLIVERRTLGGSNHG
jgi:hypothetical protein